MHLLGYVRRSQDSGTGVSEEIQRSKIEQWAKLYDHEIEWLPPDLDESSFTLDRPGLTRALVLLSEGKYDGIVAATQDRLTRKVTDFYRLLELAKEQDWHVFAVDTNLDTTKDSTLHAILAVFAQREYEEKRDRFDAARANAVLLHGVHGGDRAPLGYDFTTRGHDKKGNRQRGPLAPNADAPKVRAAFEARAEGASWRDVARILGARSKGATMKVLSNRVYLGEARSGAYVKPGAHPALVDEPLFSRVQRKVAASAKDKTQTTRTGSALLAKVLRCSSCGHALSYDASLATPGYRCGSKSLACTSKVTIAANKIEPHVLDLAVAWHAAQFPQYDALRQADDAILPVLEEELRKAEETLAQVEAKREEWDALTYGNARADAVRARDAARRAVEDAEAGQGWLALTPERVEEKLGLRFEEFEVTTPAVEALGTEETTTTRRRVVAAEAEVETVRSFIADMLRVIVAPVGRGRRVPVNQRVQVLYMTAGRTAGGETPEEFLPEVEEVAVTA